MSDSLLSFLDSFNQVVGGYVLVFILLGAGFYFTIRSRCVQLRLFRRSVVEMLAGIRHRKPGDISPFQAFATGMASRVGMGNIAGVAIAIKLGGPGAVFWMWMTALLGMASSLIECTLAQVYKEPHPDGTFRGGPAYYIRKGLGQSWLALIFVFSLLLAFGLIFNAMQSNAIAGMLKEAYQLDPVWVGVGLVVLTGPIIWGGIRKVGMVSEWMVPVMAGGYILLTAYVLVRNFSAIPEVLLLIVKSAFGFGPAAAGLTGYAVAQAVIMGVRRGLFSNEAGMGSAPNAAAAASATHPVNQALMQMLGVFVDTIIICTCTALLILLSGYDWRAGEAAGVAITARALATQVGGWSIHFLAWAVFFFAFSSIIGNYAYAEGNVDFLSKRPWLMTVFRLMVLGMVYFGAVAKVDLVWQLGDISQALMTIINVVAILLLSGIAFRTLKDYERQVALGKEKVHFDRNVLGEDANTLSEGVWVCKTVEIKH